jgi:mannonate dehydratase
MRFEDGYLHPGDAPGLGVELDEKAASKFDYLPAYLPVSRLRDGTIHDW